MKGMVELCYDMPQWETYLGTSEVAFSEVQKVQLKNELHDFLSDAVLELVEENKLHLMKRLHDFLTNEDIFAGSSKVFRKMSSVLEEIVFDTDMNAFLEEELQKPIECKSDTGFKRAARTHQSDFRWHELHCSFDPNHKYGKYGAYLKWNDAQEGKNFYSPFWEKIKKTILYRYPDSTPIQLSSIYANMLRSEHIPFNIFVPMRENYESAKKVFDELIGTGKIKRIIDIKIEYAPEKQFALNDGTSFDTFILYQHTDDNIGGIGIEIKYTEIDYPLKHGSKEEQDTKLGKNEAYANFTQHSGYYLESISDIPLPNNPLIQNKFRQIWRNHILGASMLNNEKIEYPLHHFHSVTIFPNQNDHFRKVIPEYEQLLSEYGKKSFRGITYEDFFSILDKYFITKESKDWINYLRKRYLFQ